jgi:hypothetical protein
MVIAATSRHYGRRRFSPCRTRSVIRANRTSLAALGRPAVARPGDSVVVRALASPLAPSPGCATRWASAASSTRSRTGTPATSPATPTVARRSPRGRRPTAGTSARRPHPHRSRTAVVGLPQERYFRPRRDATHTTRLTYTERSSDLPAEPRQLAHVLQAGLLSPAVLLLRTLITAGEARFPRLRHSQLDLHAR